MFYENFDRICKTRGTSPSAVTFKLGMGRNTASNWKKNNTIPKENQLKELAKYLNCKVSDFFLDNSQARFGTSQETAINAYYADAYTRAEAESDELDENEEELLRIYQECSKKQRAKLMMLVYDFEENEL